MAKVTIILEDFEAENLAEFIEYNLFDQIRNDVEIDSVDWLCGMCDAYRKLKAGADNESND